MLRALIASASAAAWMVFLPACYESSSKSSDVRSENLADPRPDPVPDTPVDGTDRLPPTCAPQEAEEDPMVLCERCHECYPTPYLWTGDRCGFLPICCQCLGADCSGMFETHGDCLSAYAACASVQTPTRYGEGRMLWQAPGGAAGMGPMVLIDGFGMVRYWHFDDGIYSVGSEEWDRTDWDGEEEIGVEAANELFDLVLSIDTGELPHPPEMWVECYVTFEVRSCLGCETIHLDFQQARDLLPEFYGVYRWLDERLCRLTGLEGLPSGYCEFYF